MTERKMNIDPAIERQEDQAIIIFLRQRCGYLAQSLSIQKEMTSSLQDELEKTKKELQELKESVMTGGQNG